MASLDLLFSSRDGEISLSSTRFLAGSGGQPVVAVRSTSLLSGQGTFQWTAAVKALCLFFVHAKFAPNSDQPTLEGGAGTAAASLDYALSKEPSWMSDMFGSDEDGRPELLAFIRRVNPNRKRPGPVRLYVLRRLLVSDAIGLFLDGNRLEFKDIPSITQSLERQLQSEKRSGRGQPREQVGVLSISQSPLSVLRGAAVAYPALRRAIERRELEGDQTGFLFPGLQGALKRWAGDEILAELSGSENFSKVDHNHSLLRISAIKMFERKVIKQLSSLERFAPFTDAESRGVSLMTEDSQSNPPLEVRLTTESIGSIALFAFLAEVEGAPFRLDFPVKQTQELVNAMLCSDQAVAGDLCSLNLVTAGEYLRYCTARNREYIPLLFSPKGRVNMLVTRNAKKSKPVFSESDYSSNSLIGYYLRSVPRSEFSLRKSDEMSIPMLSRPPEGELGVISWFPYTPMMSEIHGLRKAPASGADSLANEFRVDNILFCHRRIASDPAAMRLLFTRLRHAWVSLQESSRLREIVAALLVTDNRYMTLLRRRADFTEALEMELGDKAVIDGADGRKQIAANMR